MSSLNNIMKEIDADIHDLQRCHNNTLRVIPKENALIDNENSLFSIKRSELTLNETESPLPFHFYDHVNINTFSWLRGDEALQLDVYASFNHEQCEMRFTAHFINTKTHDNYASIELAHASGIDVFTSYNRILLEEILPADETEELSVVVECKITDFLGHVTHLLILKEIEISEPLFSLSSFELAPVYKHIYPKKEDITVVFGDAIMGKLPAIYQHDVNNIVISLRRAPEQSGDSDYVCNYNSANYYPYLAIPAKGVIQLGRSVQINAVRSRLACLEKISSGGVAPVTAQTFVSDIIEKGTLQFELKTNWETLLKQQGQLVPQTYNFTLSFEVDYQLPAGNTQTLKFLLSSKITERIRNGERIQEPLLPLKIMWGCLDKDTLITMADGQVKCINDVHIGDNILSGKDKRIATVQNAWRGTEKNLIRIETEKGDVLKATSEHPLFVKQDAGVTYTRAQSIMTGDYIFCSTSLASGWVKVIAVSVILYEDVVYNLSLDTPDGFYANGILVGDMNTQNARGF